MGGMARSSLQLPGGIGTRFYEFDEIAATKPFIEAWYARLNTLPLSEAQQQAIVDEGNEVFRLNIAIFEELRGRKRDVARALGKMAWAAVRRLFTA